MMGSSLYPKRLWISLVWILTIRLTAEGSSITWYEPPPIQTLLDTLSDPVGHLANSTQLLEGSINASLSWNFSLSSDLSFSSLTVSLGGTVIAGVALSGPGVQAGFEDKFDIRWIPFQRVTLIIFNVTTEVNGTFRCTVTTAKGFGTLNFGSKIQVHVVDPPSNIVTSSNITVTAPKNLTLNCSADGEPDPTTTWTRLSDNNEVTMPLKIVGKQDAGGYRCTADNLIGRPLTKDVFITVHERPKIDYLSSDWDVCENSTVILSCNATGEPTPNITWKRVADDEILPAVDGVYVIDSIKRNSSGRYSCKADNGVGIDSKTVNVTVRFAASIDGITNSSNTVNEGGFFNMTCHESENPLPTNFAWINKDGLLFNESVLSFINISRADAGQYRCEVENRCGTDGRNTYVNVYFKPSNVTLVANPTENENCSDLLLVIFKCGAAANPPVENYQLLKSQEIVDSSSKGTWIKNISSKGDHIYSCRALHPLGNETSANVTVTFNVPVQISVHVKSGNETLTEGGNLSLLCNASGYPNPNVTWSKLNADEFVHERSSQWLNFTNISKDASGKYICKANNTCGEKWSSVRTIDVQYKPEDVSLNTSSHKICAGEMVMLTCSAGDSNPAVENFALYKNGLPQVNETGGKVGVFNQMLYTQGQHIYGCVATNFIGNASSTNTIVEVEVPASVTVENRTIVVREGDNVALQCNSSGFPQPSVFWVNNSNYIMEAGSILNLTNIRRHNREYNCSASNACGTDSRRVDIDVQYAAEAAGSGENYSEPEGSAKLLSCPVDGNPEPEVAWYKGNDVNGRVISNAKQLEARETGCYTCSASNSLGTPVTITQCLTFVRTEEPTSSTPISTRKPMRTEEATSSTRQPIKEGPPWTIIGSVAGSVVSVAFVVALVTCWVHKKRKCIKDTKIHNSECEESLHGDSPHAKVNRAYAESGPPSASGTQGAARQQSQDLGAIPTYAVVDKSKKKKKKEEKPPIYATVDKSKKQKKKTDDKNVYDSVEEPKKERKPGEVLYAELGDFKNPAMPEVSTSPATLPPLRRPPSYEQTQYADITAFLKGDATLPQKEGNEGSEMQEQSANQSQHDVDNKETPIQEDSPCSRVNGAYAKSGPPSANSTDVSSAAQKQPAQEAGAIPTYAVVDKSKKKKKEPEEMPLVNTDKGKSKKKKKKTDDKNLYDSVEEPKKEKKPGEIFYADLGEFQQQEMPKVATSPPTLPPLKRAPSYEKTDYAEITQFLRKEATMPKVATSPPTLPPIKRAASYEKTDCAEITQFLEKEATLPREKTSNSEMKPQAANQTHDEVENKETAL